jgi:hypothetical protein
MRRDALKLGVGHRGLELRRAAARHVRTEARILVD